MFALGVVSVQFCVVNPNTRNLHIRSLTAGSSWFDCVFCYKGERRKKNEIDRLHYILVDAEVWFSKQTKHLGQVHKSVVAIYDHSTRISFFFFPFFFPSSSLSTLVRVSPLQSDQWTSVHHVEIYASPTENVGSPNPLYRHGAAALWRRPQRLEEEEKMIHRDELFNCE